MRGMWQHLERLGGGRGTSAPASGRAARASRSSRPTAASRGAASRCSRGGSTEVSRQRATRRKERARTQTPTIALAGYTNVGQVDAPERAHRRRRLGRGPPLRDARPDDARRSSTRGAATSSPTRSASSAACRTSSSRASPRRSRRRSSPTSSCTSPTRRADEERRSSRCDAVEAVLHEIGADELPVAARRSTRSTALDALGAAAARRTASRTRCRSRR